MKVLKYLALAYFILFIVLSSRTMERRDCISSMIVKEVDITRVGSQAKVPNCYDYKTITGALVLNEPKMIGQIQEQAQYLEKILRHNKFYIPYKKLAVQVQPTNAFEVSAQHMTFNPALAADTSELRKSLTRAWMLNFASQDLSNDKFLQTVFADIFVFLFWNQKIQDSDQVDKHWVRYLYSEKDICKSANTIPDQKAFCEIIEKSASANFQQLSVWSLRPFIMARFYDTYEKMDLSEKIQQAQKMAVLAGTIKWDRAYTDLTLPQLGHIYADLMPLLIGGGNPVDLKNAFQVDSIVESLHAQNLRLDSIEGRNILIKVPQGYLNPYNHSIIRMPDVNSKNLYLYQDSYPKLQDLQSKPVQRVRLFVKLLKPIEVYVPSLKLLALYRKNKILDMDVGQAITSHRIESVLGWNPVQVY